MENSSKQVMKKGIDLPQDESDDGGERPGFARNVSQNVTDHEPECEIEFAIWMAEFDRVRAGRHFTRDEMNERH